MVRWLMIGCGKGGGEKDGEGGSDGREGGRGGEEGRDKEEECNHCLYVRYGYGRVWCVKGME